MSTTVAVVGMGTMGLGVAVAALQHGLRVRGVDADPAATAEGGRRLRKRVDRHIAAGLLEPEAAEWVRAVYLAAGVEDVCEGADLVIEAAPENWAIKRATLARISAATRVAVASNTSSFPIDDLACDVSDPGRFLGIHFFNPAEWIPGVELIPGSLTRDEPLATAKGALSAMGKAAVVVRSSPGFLANRLQLALFVECARCVEEGLATEDEIDMVVRSTFGFRYPIYGPFAIADMAGLDVYASILTTLAKGLGRRFEPPASLQKLVDAGHFGVKSGEGYRPCPEARQEALLATRDRAYHALRSLQEATDSEEVARA